MREERTQGEIFRRSGKGVTKSANRSAEDGRQAAASRSDRTREDAREEARAARKHDRKRRIGRQIVDQPPHPRHPRVHPNLLIAILLGAPFAAHHPKQIGRFFSVSLPVVAASFDGGGVGGWVRPVRVPGESTPATGASPQPPGSLTRDNRRG